MGTITQKFLKGMGYVGSAYNAKDKVQRRVQNRPGYLAPFRERHAAKVAAARKRRAAMLKREEAEAKKRAAAQ